MADFLSQETTGTGGMPTVKVAGSAKRARLRRSVATFVCAGQAIGSRLVLDNVPAGARGVHHIITNSATLGGVATLTIGNAGTPAKYAAASTYTVADTPVVKKKAALMAVELAADEQQYAFVGAAALPNDGTILAIETIYTDVNP
jgi:hypothetical protein